MGVSGQVSLSQQSLGVAAGLRLTQKESAYHECSRGLVWQDACGLDRLASSFSYVSILYLFIYLRMRLRGSQSSSLGLIVPASESIQHNRLCLP